MRWLFDRHAGWLVCSVRLEVPDGIQGLAMRTIVEMVQTGQSEKQAFELVKFSEKCPVWHWALTHSLIR
jgi:hypothetical protein